MGKVVAIDAGTTGVRALVVDEQAQVVDVAYRELTQYFPRPGWVEHDPDEIWDAVVRHPGRGRRPPRRCRRSGGGHRHHEPARDPRRLRPRHRPATAPGHRLAGPADRRHLRRARAGGPPSHGAGDDRAHARPVFHRHEDHLSPAPGDNWPSPPDSPGLAFGTVDSWVLWNLTGGTRGGARSPRTLPTPAAPCCSIRPRSPGPTTSAPSSACPRTRCPRSVRRPGGSARRICPTSGRPARSCTGSRSRACWATSRRRCSGRPASTRAWSRSPTGRAASSWPTPGPIGRRHPTASR